VRTLKIKRARVFWNYAKACSMSIFYYQDEKCNFLSTYFFLSLTPIFNYRRRAKIKVTDNVKTACWPSAIAIKSSAEILTISSPSTVSSTVLALSGIFTETVISWIKFKKGKENRFDGSFLIFMVIFICRSASSDGVIFKKLVEQLLISYSIVTISSPLTVCRIMWVTQINLDLK